MRPDWVEWESVLRPLRKKNVDFAALWASSPKYEEAFKKIGQAVAEDVVLAHPDFEAAAKPDESGRPFEAFFDASDYAWAANLTQRPELFVAPKIVQMAGAAFTRRFSVVGRQWSVSCMRCGKACWPLIVLFEGSSFNAISTIRATSSPRPSWIIGGGARRCQIGP